MATEARAHEGSRLIDALEHAWATIQKQHPEVPNVVLITGSGAPKKGSKAKRAEYQKWARHEPDRWLDAEEQRRRPELFVAGELLAMGGEAVMEALLHEAAHGIAHRKGERDTSSDGNRWHNKKFAAIALTVGLLPPKKAENVIGFSRAPITTATSSRYAAAIRRLDAARLPMLDGGGQAAGPAEDDGTKEKEKTAGKRNAVECGCRPPRRIQLTPKVLADGAIKCGKCDEAFTTPDTDTELPDEPEQLSSEDQEEAQP